ncbi:MAG: class I SAM-dependent DNA methyltransferase [Planctomycetia bacterium]|nr:class I SAM-dependent DNA methyltransferase [Planctomycetia bacterium]
MTPQQFIAKWRRSNLSELSAYQQHFLDLCDLFAQPKPAEADPDGAHYTFQRGVRKIGGEKGWADVWFQGHFGWEYKGKHKDLKAAYKQLLEYRADLENPPLLVVCDLDRLEIHTNFTGTAERLYEFDLDSLSHPQNLDVVRRLWTDPESLRPDREMERITKEAAAKFQLIADGLRQRGMDSQRAAHFLMKIIFCFFAEDIGLLPPSLFSLLLEKSRRDPARLAKQMQSLFAAMAKGGDFGVEPIRYFNGGLFKDPDVIELREPEIAGLLEVSHYAWEHVEPSIFGTLFERLLDPAKRSQIGAHYTSKDDILTLVEPVLMAPLRREWEELKRKCEKLAAVAVAGVGGAPGTPGPPPAVGVAGVGGAPPSPPPATGRRAGGGVPTPATPASARRKKLDERQDLLQDFLHRLGEVRVLDPACGSGNFLFVSIQLLLDLSKAVVAYGTPGPKLLSIEVRPRQLLGIEINPYAHELALVVVWIGYLQWMHQNAFPMPFNPVLDPVETIQQMDAIIDLADAEHPQEPKWPAADVIVSNPPFLGDKKLRAALGDEYVDALFTLWGERIPNQSDVCCYWFEKARDMVARGKVKRAGLLATQGIRGGASREVLARIKESGDVFFAVSDRDWVLDGANVHVSMVAFDKGVELERTLDGQKVPSINANLTASTDVTTAKPLRPNESISFQGPVKVGRFDVTEAQAIAFLQDTNPNRLPTSDVLRPWANGESLTKRTAPMWIIDFVEREMGEAAKYGSTFEYVREHVKPERDKTQRERRRRLWWIHGEVNNALRKALAPLARYAATCQTAKHRVYVWLDSVVLPAQTVIAFARDDDYFFGVLHSRPHEVWALKLGTRLETRPRYTPTTCFETFPFAEPTDAERAAIAAAAKELDELRTNWLNPPEWTREEVLEFPGSANGPWARYVVNADKRGIGTVRYARRVPIDEDTARELAKRTLTRLYNERPTWLDLAHRRLDEAVFGAYGWDAGMGDEELLGKLLELNLERAGEEKKS